MTVKEIKENKENKILNIINLNIIEDITSYKDLLFEDLSMDSITLVKVLTLLCNEFEIEIVNISDFEMMSLKTVHDLINLITVKS